MAISKQPGKQQQQTHTRATAYGSSDEDSSRGGVPELMRASPAPRTGNLRPETEMKGSASSSGGNGDSFLPFPGLPPPPVLSACRRWTWPSSGPGLRREEQGPQRQQDGSV